FLNEMKAQKADLKFRKSLDALEVNSSKVALIRQWVKAYLASENAEDLEFKLKYVNEVVCLILFEDESVLNAQFTSPSEAIEGFRGDHGTIQNGVFQFNYHDFLTAYERYFRIKVPAYYVFRKAKHEVTIHLKEVLKLEEFKPKILSSFVRNKLIDQVYFPL